MIGRAINHEAPNNNAAMPVRMNRNGRVTDGAWTSATAARFVGRWQDFSARDGLGAADDGDKTSVTLFLCFAGETALLQQRVKMQWTTICVRVQFRTFWQL